MLVEWTDLDSCRLLPNINRQDTKEGRMHIKENSEMFYSEQSELWSRSTWKRDDDDDDDELEEEEGDNNDDYDDDDIYCVHV